MKARKESDLQRTCCDSQSNKRLREYRNRIGADSEKVIFDDRVQSVLTQYVWSLREFNRVIEYLNGLRDPDGNRFGRSLILTEKLQSHFDHFTKQDVPDFRWNRNYRKAKSKVIARYSMAQLQVSQPKSDDEAWDLFSRVDTSAGWTWIINGYRHKGDLKGDGFLKLATEKESEAIKSGSFNSYYVLSTRSQASGEFTDTGEFTGTCKLKTRPVFMEDVFTVWCGRKFAKPITEWLCGYDHSSACKSDVYTYRRIINMRSQNSWYISLDYSSYDSTQPAWLLYDAFEVIESMFPNLSSEEKALLTVLRDDFIHKNVITADGVIDIHHGDPSGSSLTTIVNGICNELITETWVEKFGYGYVDYTIQGDDNLIYGRKKFDKAQIASYVKKNFGIEVNESKTSTGDSSEFPEYLGRTWRNDGPYRHPNRIISKILFPERFRDYKRNEALSPELIIYSYILGYEAGMRELIDVDKFLMDNSLTLTEWANLNEDVKRELPYNVQLYLSQAA